MSVDVSENPSELSSFTGGLRRLVLSEFRSYRSLDIAIEADMVVVSGANGSGKTNLLEAISMFAQGRGLRRAELTACAQRPGSGGFAVSVEVTTAYGPIQYGTGLERGEGEVLVRRHRVDGEPVASARAFADRLRLVWLTPAMDSLFNGPPSDRRRFLDRLVLAVDAEHGSRVLGMERAMRQRNRILEDGARADAAWLDAVEREVAELAVAVAVARTETVARLSQSIGGRRDGLFPWGEISLSGDIEALCGSETAIAVEDRYRAILKANRARDGAAGRTLIGPHLADLLVRHGPKDIDAGLCSTGEQKALLVGLVMAHARLVAGLGGVAPIILLDEIVAHFDAGRRDALFEELAMLAGQIWMTGADEDAFAAIGGRVQRLRVEPGVVRSDKSRARPDRMDSSGR